MMKIGLNSLHEMLEDLLRLQLTLKINIQQNESRVKLHQNHDPESFGLPSFPGTSIIRSRLFTDSSLVAPRSNIEAGFVVAAVTD